MYKYHSGNKIHNWTLIERTKRVNSHQKWLCECKCGTRKEITLRSVIKGESTSCGCSTIKGQNKRDKLNLFIKNKWFYLNVRCGKYKENNTKEKCKTYENINIKFNINEFKKWCINNKDTIYKLKRPSIDRINNNLDYFLENMQIIELSENIRKDKTVFINGYGVCYKCKNRKEENQFCSDKRKLNGKTNICLECERKRGREKYLRRKLNLYLNWH